MHEYKSKNKTFTGKCSCGVILKQHFTNQISRTGKKLKLVASEVHSAVVLVFLSGHKNLYNGRIRFSLSQENHKKQHLHR